MPVIEREVNLYFDFVNERSREMGEVVGFQQPQVERNQEGMGDREAGVVHAGLQGVRDQHQDTGRNRTLLSGDTVCRWWQTS